MQKLLYESYMISTFTQTLYFYTHVSKRPDAWVCLYECCFSATHTLHHPSQSQRLHSLLLAEKSFFLFATRKIT